MAGCDAGPVVGPLHVWREASVISPRDSAPPPARSAEIQI